MQTSQVYCTGTVSVAILAADGADEGPQKGILIEVRKCDSGLGEGLYCISYLLDSSDVVNMKSSINVQI